MTAASFPCTTESSSPPQKKSTMSWWRLRLFFFVCIYCILALLTQPGLLKSPATSLFILSTVASSELLFDNSLEDDRSMATLKAATTPTPEPVKVMFCLHGGSRRRFYDEWEVAIKSVLLNAPLDVPLHIYLIADATAQRIVRRRLAVNKLVDSTWRQPVHVTLYNVEDRQDEFELFLEQHLRGNKLDKRVSMGGYYRLLSPMILPNEIGPVLYMDADAVIMGNLQDLWKHVNDTYTFQASATWLCSAFIIINMQKATSFWDLLTRIPTIDWGGDQKLLNYVVEANPEILGPLPLTWDTHLGHGFRGNPQSVLDKRPNGTGMMHFNGAPPSYFHSGLMQYCERSRSCNRHNNAKQTFERTWMLADYYIRLPWSWALYMGRSKIQPGTQGYPLLYKEVYSNSTLSEEKLKEIRDRKDFERMEELNRYMQDKINGVSRSELVELANTNSSKASQLAAIRDALLSQNQTEDDPVVKAALQIFEKRDSNKNNESNVNATTAESSHEEHNVGERLVANDNNSGGIDLDVRKSNTHLAKETIEKINTDKLYEAREVNVAEAKDQVAAIRDAFLSQNQTEDNPVVNAARQIFEKRHSNTTNELNAVATTAESLHEQHIVGESLVDSSSNLRVRKSNTQIARERIEKINIAETLYEARKANAAEAKDQIANAFEGRESTGGNLSVSSLAKCVGQQCYTEISS